MRGAVRFLAMLTSLVCLAATGAAFAQSDSYQMYASPDGYQVEVPSTWQPSTLTGPPDGTLFDSPDGSARLVLQAGSLAQAPNGLDVINGLEASLRGQQPDLATLPPAIVSVPGAVIAFTASGLFMLNGTYRDVYLMDAIQGSNLYTLTVLMAHDYAQTHLDQVQHIRSTFQLTTPSQSPPLVVAPSGPPAAGGPAPGGSAAAPGGGPPALSAGAPAQGGGSGAGGGSPLPSGNALLPVGGPLAAGGTPAPVLAAAGGAFRAAAPSSGATASATLPPGTLFQASNPSGQSVQTFTVPSDWSLHFVYDCSGFAGFDSGSFRVTVYNDDGTPSQENPPIEYTQQNGLAGDTQQYHTGGTFYLDVLSDCRWNVSVTAP